MNKTPIEYADYTWNPMVGCKHGCSYCYAERMNKWLQFIENWKEPKYFYHRLKEPSTSYALSKKAQRILVGSMTDLFGDWVDGDFIIKVIEQAVKNPLHTFLFLTKNPKRYSEFAFPRNCWLGTTIEHEEKWERLRDLAEVPKINLKFISFEPLLSEMSELDLSDDLSWFKTINWFIIGGLTPYKDAMGDINTWVRNLLDIADAYSIPVFMKNDLKHYWLGEWRRELP